MTNEQKIFFIGKDELGRLDKIAQTRELTAKEKEDRDEIKSLLFEVVYRFGLGLARQRIEKYEKDSDAMPDIMQGIAEIFYERLPYYDPEKSTPTTYYLRYFNQVITNYIAKNSQKVSQYDSHNISLVRGAMNHYEERGIKWDLPMIVNYTGLSPKVVKYTISLAANSKQANIDDNINISSKQPTPEEEYISNEKKKTIYRVLRECLDDEELHFFLYKVNLDGAERTYQQVADDLGMKVRDVKKKWSGIIARLNADTELRTYDPHSRSNKGATVTLHEAKPAGMDESLFFSGLGSVPLHNPDAGNGSGGQE